ncbi:MAG: hypothetical protein Q9163_002815 [Psora crenata]
MVTLRTPEERKPQKRYSPEPHILLTRATKNNNKKTTPRATVKKPKRAPPKLNAKEASSKAKKCAARKHSKPVKQSARKKERRTRNSNRNRFNRPVTVAGPSNAADHRQAAAMRPPRRNGLSCAPPKTLSPLPSPSRLRVHSPPTSRHLESSRQALTKREPEANSESPQMGQHIARSTAPSPSS